MLGCYQILSPRPSLNGLELHHHAQSARGVMGLQLLLIIIDDPDRHPLSWWEATRSSVYMRNLGLSICSNSIAYYHMLRSLVNRPIISKAGLAQEKSVSSLVDTWIGLGYGRTEENRGISLPKSRWAIQSSSGVVIRKDGIQLLDVMD